ncbi:MAG: hypothetical protein HY059_09100 [Proteobacteria bacterium]|nr:hypothetical protein [Pseudomonadota bacterium]
MAIREDQIGQLHLLVISLDTVRVESRLVFFRRTARDTIELLARGFNENDSRAPDDVLATVPILSKDESGRYFVISADALFTQDIGRQGIAMSRERRDGRSPVLRSDRTSVREIGTFPGNVDVQARLAFVGPEPTAEGQEPHIHYYPIRYSLIGAQSRAARAQPGDAPLSAAPDIPDPVEPRDALAPAATAARRWDLKKAVPAAAVSEVSNPVVFWLEERVPETHREAVRQGVRAFNAAIEKAAGMTGAIVLKEAGLHPADAAYHLVGWLTGSASPNAGQEAMIAKEASDFNIFKAIELYQRWERMFRTATAPPSQASAATPPPAAGDEHALRQSLAADVAQLEERERALATMRGHRRPVTADERFAYENLMHQLRKLGNQEYVESKLSQIYDLRNPVSDDDARLRFLSALEERYSSVLLPQSGDTPGRRDPASMTLAVRRMAQDALTRMFDGSRANPQRNIEAQPTMNAADKKKIEDLVAEIEQLRLTATAELAARDATGRMLAAVNSTRNAALRERRNPAQMMEFRKNFARWATVQDLKLAMAEALAAEEAIKNLIQIVEQKIAKIVDTRNQTQQNLQLSQNNQAQVEQWKKDAQEAIKADQSQIDDFKKLQRQASQGPVAISAFQTRVRAFISMVDGRDGKGGGALAKYDENLKLLPTIVGWITDGKPGDSNFLNIKEAVDNRKYAQDVIDKIDRDSAKLQGARGAPLEFAGPIVLGVPGIPDFEVHNAPIGAYLSVLAERKRYWKDEKLARYQQLFKKADDMTKSSGAGRENDEFGESHPVALAEWIRESEDKIKTIQGKLSTLTSEIDGHARVVQKIAPNANLPSLSGKGLTELQDTVQDFPDRIGAVSFPAETDQNMDDLFDAKIALLKLGMLLPETADFVIQWSKAQAVVDAAKKPMTETLPTVRAALKQVVDSVQMLVDDIDKDVVFVTNFRQPANDAQRAALMGQVQEMINRKAALLPVLKAASVASRDMLERTLIPYLEDSKKIYAQNDGEKGYFKLFNSQIKLYNAAAKAVNRTLPWSVATGGVKDGDAGAGVAAIRSRRATYQKYFDGYDSGGSRKKGINEYKIEVECREKESCSSPKHQTETLYGEVQPFSLPKKIAQYGRERDDRAKTFNTHAKETNTIMAKLDSLTQNKFTLIARFKFSENVTKADMEKIKTENTIQRLGTVLLDIVKEYDKGNTVGGLLGNTTTVPVGQQPPTTVDQNTLIALEALQVARRLVPVDGRLESSPLSYCVARFLFADAVATAASDALRDQVPAAKTFLQTAESALNAAIAALGEDEAYVSAHAADTVHDPGVADAVVNRAITTYGKLNDFLIKGLQFFGMKKGWDESTINTIVQAGTYYNATTEIMQRGIEVSNKEIDAMNRTKDVLNQTFADLEKNRIKFTNWLNQLNPREYSALRRVGDSLREIQEKTKAVLERNVDYHKINDDFKRAEEILKWSVRKLDERQGALQRELDKLPDASALPADLARRVQALSTAQGSWMMQQGQNQAMVVKKSEFPRFLEQVFSMFSHSPSAQDLGAIKQAILNNPQQLATLIPNSKLIDFGDNADGFYLVYQSNFSTPHGLEAGTSVTLGNVGQIGGNNISVTGYQFASPANEENAPYGDRGVEVQIESLQGKNWVNYLNIDLHRFIQNVPPNMGPIAGAQQTRLMVFEDFAMFLFGDKLYVAATGFGDWATANTWEQPSYYGGTFKASLKFSEVATLNAEQQLLFARDPRWFLQCINLNFTGFDPDLNKDVCIKANGQDTNFSRTQVGPTIDLAKMLGQKDAFKVDFFLARQTGTEDVNQNSMGMSVLKGFSIRDENGKPWLQINNRATAEMGTEQNVFSDRVSFVLPDYGIAFNAQGQIAGKLWNGYAGVEKKMNDHSSVVVGYGSLYPGMPNRLQIGMNSSFTLGELWRSVTQQTVQQLAGGTTLKEFNEALDKFFAPNGANSRTVNDLKAVYMQDIARKLLMQEIGRLTKELEDLRKAGALLDNTRVRGVVGYATNPVGDSFITRALGGGFTAGTVSELTLNRTRSEHIDENIQRVFRECLRLQERMLQLTQEWQAIVVEIAESQWEWKLARFMHLNASSEEMRQAGNVEEARAKARFGQAIVRYNMLTGRSMTDMSPPFRELNSADLRELIREMRGIVAAPGRLTQIFQSLREEDVRARLGANPFNILDYIPFIDRVTVSFGVQYQDMLASQMLGLSISVRLPIYDPASREENKAYVLRSQAVAQEMLHEYQKYELSIWKDAAEASYWKHTADTVRPQVADAAARLGEAIPAYRNNEMTDAELRDSFERWRSLMTTLLRAEGRAALADERMAQNSTLAREPKDPKAHEAVTITSVDDAFRLASQNSHNLAEIARRQEAAAHMTAANEGRIRRAYVDLVAGMNLTSSGLALIPQFGITGLPVMPILGFELQPAELETIQVRRGEAEKEMYENVKKKVELGLAVQFYNNVVLLKTAEDTAKVLDEQLVPRLEAEAAQARASGNAAAAQMALARAKDQRNQIWLTAVHARQTLNHLLGRSPDAPIDVSVTVQSAFQSLQRIIAEKKPVETVKKILDARVQIARGVQTRVDKGLKIEELKFEPISLIMRSVGRLVSALSQAGIANPDLAKAAEIQRLESERARDSYANDLVHRRASAQSELALARQRVAGLEGKDDPASRIELQQWRQKAQLLEATVALLGEPGAPEAQPEQPMPGSFSEMEDRVRDAYRALGASQEPPPLDIFDPERLTHDQAGYLRYFYAQMDLDKTAINKHYLEGWIEVRLRSQDTPAEVMVSLARLRQEKADRIRFAAASQQAAEGEILVRQFEANVRLLRWAEAENKEDVAQNVRERLAVQKDRIAALLRLPPGTSLEDLARLVPQDAAGDHGGERVAETFIAEVSRLNVERLREQIFANGIPDSFANADNMMEQLRADVIAERMSYKGFTPVAAFGVFRGISVGGGWLEAPDPRQIEAGLVKILSDSLKRELESQGRMRELTLRLHLLMRGVQDKTQLLEHQRRLVLVVQDSYRAASVLHGPGSLEALSAQDALTRAWADLTKTAAELKSEFITLVSELEAIGYGEKERSVGLRPLRPPVRHQEGDEPELTVARYLSRRMADEDFSKRFQEILGGTRVDQRLRAELRDAASLYAAMAKDGEAVRHMEMPTEERFELLVKADIEGRRQRVERLMHAIMKALQAEGLTPTGAAGELIAVIRDDMETQVGHAEATRADEAGLLTAMRESYWRAFEAPPHLAGEFHRLESLHKAALEARQSLLERWMSRTLRPHEFVMRDQAIDAFIKAQDALDIEIIKIFEREEVSSNRPLAIALDGLFDFREALKRARDRAKYGRGMAAINVLIMIEEERLATLRHEGAPPEEQRKSAVALENLRAMKRRWQTNPHELRPLYAVIETDADGRRNWDVKDWRTQEQIESMLTGDTPGIIQENGRFWLAENGVKTNREVVSGADVSGARRDAADRRVRTTADTRRLAEVLEASDFALTTPEGSVLQPMSYAEMMRHAQEGRLFYFSKTPERELNPAIHPMEALWLTRQSRPDAPSRPEDSEIYVYTGAQPLSREAFPTRQSLEAHIRRLAASHRAEDREEASKFAKLEMGDKGAQAMIQGLQERRVRSLRAGWLNLKLNTYGFALGRNGLTQVYLTQQEYDAQLAAFRGAPEKKAQAQRRLAQAQAEVGAAERDMLAKKRVSEEENRKFQQIRARLIRGVEAQARRNARVASQGDLSALDAARVEQAATALLVRNDEFTRAQKAYADKLSEFQKANEKFMDLKRKAEVADQDIKDADTLIENSGVWQLYVSRDVQLLVDSGKAIVGVDAAPAHGTIVLNARFGQAQGEVRRLGGEMYAAVLDRDMNLVEAHMNRDDVERAAATWTLQTVDGRPIQDSTGGRTIDPKVRVSHYVDPRTGQPVLLSRRYMIERANSARQELDRTKNWGLQWWNWGQLPLEVIRGIVKAPLEVITGRDPNQEGYIGTVYAYKAEGGSRAHQGFFRQVAGKLDILELFPDPIDRYFDPSQFPSRVQVNGGLRPGANVFDRGARTADRDIIFGKDYVQRILNQANEELQNARMRPFSYFNGGVQTTIVETRRGRNGPYQTSTVRERHGTDAILDALRNPSVHANPRSDGTGTVTISGEPGHIAVDRVEQHVTIRQGARQSDQAARNLEAFRRLIGRRFSNLDSEEAVAEERRLAEADLNEQLASRRGARDNRELILQRERELGRRVREQETVDIRERAARAEIEALKRKIQEKQRLLREFDEAKAKAQAAAPAAPSAPTAPAAQPRDQNRMGVHGAVSATAPAAATGVPTPPRQAQVTIPVRPDERPVTTVLWHKVLETVGTIRSVFP